MNYDLVLQLHKIGTEIYNHYGNSSKEIREKLLKVANTLEKRDNSPEMEELDDYNIIYTYHE